MTTYLVYGRIVKNLPTDFVKTPLPPKKKNNNKKNGFTKVTGSHTTVNPPLLEPKLKI